MPAGEGDPAGRGDRRGTDALDALAGRISEEVDRPLFEEAAKCFAAGALRAAYIMAWITVAESLRNRFSAMAERGDAQAGGVLKGVEEREKRDRPADLYLLEQACKLGLVDEERLRKLAHVREMRNLYAHPTGTGPTEQETLAALEVIVDAVLSEPPLLRHGYAEHQLDALFGERHWLPDDEMAVREHAAGVAHRLHPAAAPYLLKGLVERYAEILGDPERDAERRRAEWFVSGFLEELAPDLSEPRWRLADLVLRRPAAASLLLGVPGVFGLLPDQARDMVFGHLVAPVAGGEPSVTRLLGLRRARALASADLLSPAQLDAVRATVDETPYRALQGAGVPLEAYVDRLLDDLRSHTWDRQNAAAAAVGNAGPARVSGLRPEVQEQLGRNVLQAAEGSAFGAQGLLQRVRRSPSSWPEPFVLGLLLEALVDDDGRFRLKGGHLPDVLAVALSRERARETLGRARSHVRASEPKGDAEDYLPGRGWVNQYDEAARILEDAKRDAPGRSDLLDDLIRAVRSAKPAEEKSEG
ncbi:MAG: hypothetical protein AB1425_09260 [Actinomycetota bacterium]